MNITLTDRAKEKLAELLAQNPPPDLRLYAVTNGCGGSALSMTPEGNPDVPAAQEGSSNARRFEVGGFVFFINPELAQRTGPINIDFTRGIFNLVSNIGQSCIDGCGACGRNLVLPKA